jgi:hypothetical protein
VNNYVPPSKEGKRPSADNKSKNRKRESNNKNTVNFSKATSSTNGNSEIDDLVNNNSVNNENVNKNKSKKLNGKKEKVERFSWKTVGITSVSNNSFNILGSRKKLYGKFNINCFTEEQAKYYRTMGFKATFNVDGNEHQYLHTVRSAIDVIAWYSSLMDTLIDSIILVDPTSGLIKLAVRFITALHELGYDRDLRFILVVSHISDQTGKLLYGDDVPEWELGEGCVYADNYIDYLGSGNYFNAAIYYRDPNYLNFKSFMQKQQLMLKGLDIDIRFMKIYHHVFNYTFGIHRESTVFEKRTYQSTSAYVELDEDMVMFDTGEMKQFERYKASFLYDNSELIHDGSKYVKVSTVSKSAGTLEMALTTIRLEKYGLDLRKTSYKLSPSVMKRIDIKPSNNWLVTKNFIGPILNKILPDSLSDVFHEQKDCGHLYVPRSVYDEVEAYFGNKGHENGIIRRAINNASSSLKCDGDFNYLRVNLNFLNLYKQNSVEDWNISFAACAIVVDIMNNSTLTSHKADGMISTGLKKFRFITGSIDIVPKYYKQAIRKTWSIKFWLLIALMLLLFVYTANSQECVNHNINENYIVDLSNYTLLNETVVADEIIVSNSQVCVNQGIDENYIVDLSNYTLMDNTIVTDEIVISRFDELIENHYKELNITNIVNSLYGTINSSSNYIFSYSDWFYLIINYFCILISAIYIYTTKFISCIYDSVKYFKYVTHYSIILINIIYSILCILYDCYWYCLINIFHFYEYLMQHSATEFGSIDIEKFQNHNSLKWASLSTFLIIPIIEELGKSAVFVHFPLVGIAYAVIESILYRDRLIIAVLRMIVHNLFIYNGGLAILFHIIFNMVITILFSGGPASLISLDADLFTIFMYSSALMLSQSAEDFCSNFIIKAVNFQSNKEYHGELVEGINFYNKIKDRDAHNFYCNLVASGNIIDKHNCCFCDVNAIVPYEILNCKLPTKNEIIQLDRTKNLTYIVSGIKTVIDAKKVNLSVDKSPSRSSLVESVNSGALYVIIHVQDVSYFKAQHNYESIIVKNIISKRLMNDLRLTKYYQSERRSQFSKFVSKYNNALEKIHKFFSEEASLLTNSCDNLDNFVDCDEIYKIHLQKKDNYKRKYVKAIKNQSFDTPKGQIGNSIMLKEDEIMLFKTLPRLIINGRAEDALITGPTAYLLQKIFGRAVKMIKNKDFDGFFDYCDRSLNMFSMIPIITEGATQEDLSLILSSVYGHYNYFRLLLINCDDTILFDKQEWFEGLLSYGIDISTCDSSYRYFFHNQILNVFDDILIRNGTCMSKIQDSRKVIDRILQSPDWYQDRKYDYSFKVDHPLQGDGCTKSGSTHTFLNNSVITLLHFISMDAVELKKVRDSFDKRSIKITLEKFVYKVDDVNFCTASYLKGTFVYSNDMFIWVRLPSFITKMWTARHSGKYYFEKLDKKAYIKCHSMFTSQKNNLINYEKDYELFMNQVGYAYFLSAVARGWLSSFHHSKILNYLLKWSALTDESIVLENNAQISLYYDDEINLDMMSLDISNQFPSVLKCISTNKKQKRFDQIYVRTLCNYYNVSEIQFEAMLDDLCSYRIGSYITNDTLYRITKNDYS